MAAELPSALTQRFQIGGVIASGQAGTTYRVVELATGRAGALKIITAARAWTAAERGRLGRELEKLATLKHPYLADTWGTGVTEDAPWVFRAEISGESLRAKIDASRAAGRPVEQALLYTAQIAAALDEVHRAGLLQRDLSPEHVIVRAEGSVAIIDTGVATRIASASVFEIAGKPAYVSPEHAAGKLVSFRSDLYGLGCMLFEMLTGAPPFGGAPDAVLEAHRSKAPPALTGQPAPVTALVAQLLQKDPRDRPFSAQQVRRTLEPLTGPLPIASGKPAPQHGTLLGLAAVSAPQPGSPRADSTEQLTALDLAKGGPPPAPPPRPAPRPDGTEQLSALDLARAESMLASRPKEASSSNIPSQGQSMQRQSVPPPVPAHAKRTSQPPPPPPPRNTLAGAAGPGSGQIAVPASGQVPIPAPSSAELDYDDFAETKAVSRDMVNELRALGGLDSIDPALAQAQPSTPGLAVPPAPAPSSPGTAQAAPQQGFGTPQQGFGAPQQGFGAPQQGFGAPQQGFGAQAAVAPTQAFPAPQQGFGGPQQGFGAPQQGFGAPQQGFGAPQQGFGASSSPGAFPAQAPAQAGFQGAGQGFGAPAPAYVAPAPEPKKSRTGLWIALGLMSFCGLSTVALAGAGWFLDLGGMQTQILAATSGAPAIPVTPTAPVAPPVAPPVVTPVVVAPTPAVVRVTIDSVPPGAAITLNGQPAGVAPVTREVPRDSMLEARAILAGHNEDSMRMQVGSDSTITLHPQPRTEAAVAVVAPVPVPATTTTTTTTTGGTRPTTTTTGTTTTSGTSPGGGLAGTSRPTTGTTTGTTATSTTTTGTTTTGTTTTGTTTSGTPSGGTGLAARIRPATGATGTTTTGTTTTGTTTTGTTTTGTTTTGTTSTGAPRLASGLRPSSGGAATGTGTATTTTTTPSAGTTSTGTARPSSAGSTSPPPAGGGSVDDLRAQARAHFQARRFREAAETYERATRMAPTNVNLWSGLGAARLAGGDNAGAVQAYERAVQLAPTTAAYHAALGRAYLQSGNRDGARREFQRALELDPQNRDAQTGMSRL